MRKLTQTLLTVFLYAAPPTRRPVRRPAALRHQWSQLVARRPASPGRQRGAGRCRGRAPAHATLCRAWGRWVDARATAAARRAGLDVHLRRRLALRSRQAGVARARPTSTTTSAGSSQPASSAAWQQVSPQPSLGIRLNPPQPTVLQVLCAPCCHAACHWSLRPLAAGSPARPAPRSTPPPHGPPPRRPTPAAAPPRTAVGVSHTWTSEFLQQEAKLEHVP